MRMKWLERFVFVLIGIFALCYIMYQVVTVSYKYGHNAGHNLGRYSKGLSNVNAYGEGYADGYKVGQKHPLEIKNVEYSSPQIKDGWRLSESSISICNPSCEISFKFIEDGGVPELDYEGEL